MIVLLNGKFCYCGCTVALLTADNFLCLVRVMYSNLET